MGELLKEIKKGLTDECKTPFSNKYSSPKFRGAYTLFLIFDCFYF
jgi:hypothetical protein